MKREVVCPPYLSKSRQDKEIGRHQIDRSNCLRRQVQDKRGRREGGEEFSIAECLPVIFAYLIIAVVRDFMTRIIRTDIQVIT